MTKQSFSNTLGNWLASKQKKTIGSMLDIFDEKSFAFIFLVLMIFPATPIPTGGIVHVFEVIVMLVALQLLIGRQDLWLPRRLQRIELSRSTREKVLPFLLRRVQFFERFARPRLSKTMRQKWFRMQLGLTVTLLAAGAFFAPPFTGLDTLPSMGVVLIAIGIILDDVLLVGAGYIVGYAGIALAIFLGAGIITAIGTLF
ncbi:MAG: exopolysaccharide biosynthesis protein [Patescibacteria group bacterium]